MKTVMVCGLLLVLVIAPALGQPPRTLVPNASLPLRLPEDGPNLPYAINYTDELAQKLGVKDGQLGVPLISPSRNYDFLPSLSARIDRNGAMLKFQWQPSN